MRLLCVDGLGQGGQDVSAMDIRPDEFGSYQGGRIAPLLDSNGGAA